MAPRKRMIIAAITLVALGLGVVTLLPTASDSPAVILALVSASTGFIIAAAMLVLSANRKRAIQA